MNDLDVSDRKYRYFIDDLPKRKGEEVMRRRIAGSFGMTENHPFDSWYWRWNLPHSLLIFVLSELILTRKYRRQALPDHQRKIV
jgi:hypothetical protein